MTAAEVYTKMHNKIASLEDLLEQQDKLLREIESAYFEAPTKQEAGEKMFTLIRTARRKG